MPATAPSTPALNYKVVKGQVGPFPPGHVFTTDEFRHLHPIPENPKQAGIDPDTYHADAIERLKLLGVITEAASHETPAAMPLGPEGKPPEAVRNPGIAAAVAQELKNREQMAAIQAEQVRQGDEVPATATPSTTGTRQVPAGGQGGKR